MRKISFLASLFLVLSTFVCVQAAKPVSAEDRELVKKSNDPMANMISMPFQFNYDYGSGPDEDGNQLTVNVQPIIPISINEDFLVLSRTVLPIKYLDSSAMWGEGTTVGLGDTVQSFYFGPKEGSVKWGVGPAIMLPTATEPALSAADDRWSAGPAGIFVYQPGTWTFAAIGYQVWSFAGPTNSGDVNFLFFQPVVMKSFGLFSAGFNSEIQRDWQHHETIIPINFMFSKLVRFGKLPINVAAGARWYVEKPDYYSKWGARLALTFLLPESIFTGKK